MNNKRNKRNKNIEQLFDYINQLNYLFDDLIEPDESDAPTNSIKENEILFNKYFDSHNSVICVESYMSSDIKPLEYTYIKYESETGTVYVIDDNNITYAFFVYDINWFITLRKNKFSNLIDIGHENERLVVTELEDEYE